MDIKQKLIENKPELSQSSLKAYNSTLTTLHKKAFNNDNYNLDNFNNTQVINEYLKDKPANKRKVIYSALLALTNNQLYRDKMLSDINTYNAEIETQTKSETQQQNWAEEQTIQSVFSKLSDEAKKIYKKKDKSMGDLQNLQNYIIVALLGGVYIPPRRSMDYVEFKIRNVNPETDNYFDKNKFVFNKYKTAKVYGRQEVEVPIQIRNILKKWIAINPTEYLLFDTNMNKLTNVSLNQRLNKIFNGKKIGVNALRHSYLTDKYGDTSRQISNLTNDMTMMGSSILMQKNYIKLK